MEQLHPSFEAVYIALFAAPKGGCCSVSDDLYCSHRSKIYSFIILEANNYKECS